MSYQAPKRFTQNQINTLKSEIKTLSKLISDQVAYKASAKYGVTSAQNAIARKLGYTAFSELRLYMVPTEHHESVPITDHLSVQQLFEAYQGLKLAGKEQFKVELTPEHVQVAIDEFKFSISTPEETSISLLELYKLANDSEYSAHKYTEGYGFPSEFTVKANSAFFKQFKDFDHFRVYDGDDYRCYTVNEFSHIYDNVRCFKVVLGRWFENGFSTGVK